jgi:hypothetical protein
LRNVETGGGRRTPSGFGGGDEVADLTESRGQKNFDTDERFFELCNCLLRRKKSGTSFVRV